MIKYTAFLGLLFIVSCFPTGDLLVLDDSFSKKPSEAVFSECLKDNPALNRDQCNIKKCFAAPLTLLAMQDLLVNTAEVLNKNGLHWALDSGSTIAAERFNAHLPWDDDVDIGVLATQYTDEMKKKIASDLYAQGLELKPLFGAHFLGKMTGRQGIDVVSYRENSFKKLILNYKPNIDPVDLNNLWVLYEGGGSRLPHLDIFIYEEVTPGQYLYTSTHFAGSGQLKGSTIPKDVLLGNRHINVLGKQFPTVNNFIEYGKRAYKVEDLLTNFYISRQHSSGCSKISYPNIKNSPHTLGYLLDYLEFVFTSDAAKRMDMHFNRPEVEKRYK